MGRKEKIIKEKIIDEIYIDKREIGYYSTPSFICDYIAKRIVEINNNGKSVLDPCCGREEMLEPFNSLPIKIYGIDIVKYKTKYKCTFNNTDFLNYYCSIADEDKKSMNYDYYVLNPPYNCHEVKYIKENKNKLKKYFSDVGIQNMYGMFISAIIDLAKDKAVIGIITHDSFFTSKIYKGLRRKILKTCSIHEITMCPIDLFLDQGAEVRTSIILLQKGASYQKNIIINNRCTNKDDLKRVLISKNSKTKVYSLEDIILKSNKDNTEFIIECPKDIKSLFNGDRLGDNFKCITGISTGNDKLYLSKEKVEPYTVPFYKNPGKDRFYTDKVMYINKEFINISKRVPNFMVRNKDLLYKPGVICSSMGVQFTACKLPKESTFGVNTCIVCNEEESFLLLAYLNSTLVTYLVRGVLIRTNMITSGYVSRIPMINFNDGIRNTLVDLGKLAYEKSKQNHCIDDILIKIDQIINKVADLSQETILYINEFKNNLVKRT